MGLYLKYMQVKYIRLYIYRTLSLVRDYSFSRGRFSQEYFWLHVFGGRRSAGVHGSKELPQTGTAGPGGAGRTALPSAVGGTLRPGGVHILYTAHWVHHLLRYTRILTSL